MGGEFKTHGLDRVQTAVKQAIGSTSARRFVEVEFSGGSESEYRNLPGPRPTGAVLVNSTLELPAYTAVWTVEGTTLTVNLNGNRTGIMTFWLI